MGEKKMPKSIRKYIRQEKSRIRREVLDIKEQQKQVQELYKQFLKEPPKTQEKSIQKTG